MADAAGKLVEQLWKIYRRPERPDPWQDGGNLPWNDPDFSARMLREHLDQSHGAASRTEAERAWQLEWLQQHLSLQSGTQVFDVTCGPGLYAVALAQRGCQVLGVDFGPASIAYARDLARSVGVDDHCHFIEQDVRTLSMPESRFEVALFLYGQLAVFPRQEAARLLAGIYQSLKPGGQLVVELLDPARIDKQHSTWWFTDHQGLWGDGPFLHLGERFWDDDTQVATERFSIVHLETGQLDEIILSDQAYTAEGFTEMLRAAGFSKVAVYPCWDQGPIYDGEEWIVYIATR